MCSPLPSEADRKIVDAMDGMLLEGLVEEGLSLEQLTRRFGKHPSTIGYWVKKHGLEPPNRAKHAARGGLTRDSSRSSARGCRSGRSPAASA